MLRDFQEPVSAAEIEDVIERINGMIVAKNCMLTSKRIPNDQL
jgi:hypothetical protein